MTSRPARSPLCLLATILSFAPAAFPQAPHSPADEVRQAAATLVAAFNDLDWSGFADSWDEDATAFLPLRGQPHRVEGRSAIVAAFKQVFGDLPARMSGPPYLSIQPREVEVQVQGESAVVTFHLGDSPPFSRRTLVFARWSGRWRITHLHGSDPPR